jgi:hypothetical protein
LAAQLAAVPQQYDVAPLAPAVPAPQLRDATGVAPLAHVYPVKPAPQATVESMAQVGMVVAIVALSLQQYRDEPLGPGAD